MGPQDPVGVTVETFFLSLHRRGLQIMEDDMQVKLLVERDANECFAKVAGINCKFIRNEYGDLVADIPDAQIIGFISDPHNSAFILYTPPKERATKAVKAAEGVEVVAAEEDYRTEEGFAAVEEERTVGVGGITNPGDGTQK